MNLSKFIKHENQLKRVPILKIKQNQIGFYQLKRKCNPQWRNNKTHQTKH